MKNVNEQFEYRSETFRGTIYGAYNIGFTDDGTFTLDGFRVKPPAPLPHEPRIHGGLVFTTVAISSMDYREKYGQMKAGFKRKDNTISVYDDLGYPTRITAHKHMIDTLEMECRLNGLQPVEGR